MQILILEKMHKARIPCMLICIMNAPFAGRKILRGAVAAAFVGPSSFRNVCEEFRDHEFRSSEATK
jgi:hypothetical protein